MAFKVSRARACRLAVLSRSTFYRKSRAPQQLELRRRIGEIAMARPRFGYQRIYILLRREGWSVNHKRVHQLYCLEGLQVRMRVQRPSGSAYIAGRRRFQKYAMSAGAWILCMVS